jgi:hypothetical protein
VLRTAARAARVDHVTCAVPRGSEVGRALLAAGYLPSGRGPTLVTNVLDPSTGPDASQLSSWALSLGDIEVF